MVPHYAVVLSLHHHPDIFRYVLKGLPITSLCNIFAAFAFFEDGEVGTTRGCCLQVHPATVHRSSDTAPHLGFAAVLSDQLLQIGGASGALLGASQKYRLQLAVLSVFCGSAKAVFPIF